MAVAQLANYKTQSANEQGTTSSAAVLGHASNELVLAVVGHVGSGTTEIASALKSLLSETPAGVSLTHVEIIKATDVIAEWAEKQGLNPPDFSDGHKKTLEEVQNFQDLGDEMRKADSAAVARGFVIRIRNARAAHQAQEPGDSPVIPDGRARAFILDSIRHPAEVELLRHIYQEAFVLIGVVCEEGKRLSRVMDKYAAAGRDVALNFMRRDSKAKEKYGQRVSDAFHLGDFFVDNTTDRYKDDGLANPDWDVSEKLSRLIKIIRHSEIVRPELNETAMAHAQSAALRSACLSRQVGAALTDKSGNVLSTGCNEVPKAGGGVYGDIFDADHAEDHRCAYRKIKGSEQPYCSNTREHNRIIEEVIGEISQVKQLDTEEHQKLRKALKDGPIGSLIEFSRAVHAEMDAIMSAARTGASTIGARLFVTTFPCHYCARHIVSAGIDEVQYIEPYPKSQALDLHSDAIGTTKLNWKAPSLRFVPLVNANEQPTSPAAKVLFRPFTGVAPRLYRRAFTKDRDLKSSTTGNLELGQPDWGTP